MQVLTAGFLVADIIAVELPKIADEGELIFTPKGIQLSIGGHAANVSIDLRQLGIPAGEVGLIGAVGKDIFGQFIRNTLEKHKIVTHLQELENIGTTKNIILVVKNQDRRFHLDLGATWHLDPEMVEEYLKRIKPPIFYAATGIVGKFDDQLVNVLRTAKEIGSVTFVDIVRPFKKGWDFIIPSLKFIDIFHCNDIEAKEITGKKELLDALEFMIDAGLNVAFVTMGQRGAEAMNKNGEHIRQRCFEVQAIDPTGAGDAFCAGVMYELIRSDLSDFKKGITLSRLKQILMYGQAAGAACVTGIGTTTNVTDRNVRNLVEEQGDHILKNTEILKK